MFTHCPSQHFLTRLLILMTTITPISLHNVLKSVFYTYFWEDHNISIAIPSKQFSTFGFPNDFLGFDSNEQHTIVIKHFVSCLPCLRWLLDHFRRVLQNWFLIRRSFFILCWNIFPETVLRAQTFAICRQLPGRGERNVWCNQIIICRFYNPQHFIVADKSWV